MTQHWDEIIDNRVSQCHMTLLADNMWLISSNVSSLMKQLSKHSISITLVAVSIEMFESSCMFRVCHKLHVKSFFKSVLEYLRSLSVSQNMLAKCCLFEFWRWTKDRWICQKQDKQTCNEELTMSFDCSDIRQTHDFKKQRWCYEWV